MMQAEVSLIEVERAVERSRRPCLREFAVINPAEGCLADCLFCGLASRARPPARLRVKSNLVELLAEDLARKSSNRPPPRALSESERSTMRSSSMRRFSRTSGRCSSSISQPPW